VVVPIASNPELPRGLQQSSLDDPYNITQVDQDVN